MTRAAFEPRPPVCGACGGGALEVFHDVASVPVHDTVLLDTAEQAMAFPTGRLQLALCHTCGLIQNTAFDENLLDYSSGYEEAQGCSPRFSDFAKALAEQLVERHGLSGRHVLEVGCGKGEFLDLLCRTSQGTGLGFDPAFVAGRSTSRAWTVLERRFGEQDTGQQADLVCCRHTLEHVLDVRTLLGRLARTAANQDGAVLYIEVPDVGRVLREGAFWDVYYEHCSYFSAGSLARLSAACGLAVDRLDLVFGGQYLGLECRPARGRLDTGLPGPGPDDLPAMVREVASFRRTVATAQERWRHELSTALEQGQEIVVWGASSKAVGFLTTLSVGGPGSPAVERLVDINPHKTGRYLPGTSQVVVAPEQLVERPPDVVVVMNPIYVEEIRTDLAARGLEPRLVAL